MKIVRKREQKEKRERKGKKRAVTEKKKKPPEAEWDQSVLMMMTMPLLLRLLTKSKLETEARTLQSDQSWNTTLEAFSKLCAASAPEATKGFILGKT